MPAPSPITNPSRWASNGREARCGSSFRVDKARRAQNPASPNGRDRRLSPSRQHAVGVAAGDHPIGISDGMGARRAGRRVSCVRSPAAVFDRNIAGRLIDDDRKRKRRDAVRTSLEQGFVASPRSSPDPPIPEPI